VREGEARLGDEQRDQLVGWFKEKYQDMRAESSAK